MGLADETLPTKFTYKPPKSTHETLGKVIRREGLSLTKQMFPTGSTLCFVVQRFNSSHTVTRRTAPPRLDRDRSINDAGDFVERHRIVDTTHKYGQKIAQLGQMFVR